MTLFNYGLLLEDNKDYRRAREYIEKAVKISADMYRMAPALYGYYIRYVFGGYVTFMKERYSEEDALHFIKQNNLLDIFEIINAQED